MSYASKPSSNKFKYLLLDWILKSLTFDTEQLKAINFIFWGFEPCRLDFGLFGLFDLMTEGHEAFENL